MKSFFPNFLTSLNLLLGCLGILFCFHQKMEWACYCIGIAAIFDFFDGFVARLLKVNGDFGKQLDSLADVVTFGVLPGFILFQMISICLGEYFTPIYERSTEHLCLALIAMLVPVFSALRLAKFNIDTRQSLSFLGLPTPANAIFIASIPLFISDQYGINLYAPLHVSTLEYLNQHFYSPFEISLFQILYNKNLYIVLSVIMSAFLVSEIPLLAMKFKGGINLKNHILKISLLAGIGLITFIFIQLELFMLCIPVSILWYIVLSLIGKLSKSHEI